MHIPARLLRDQADDMPGACPRLSARDQVCRDRILDAGQALMARHGRAALKFTDFALGLRMAPATIRRHFVDLDALLAAILLRHLMAVAAALGEIPHDSPDRQARMRGAYLACTRTAFNAPTSAHLLLIRDRHALPPDLADHVERTRLGIGHGLAGEDAAGVLTLLDTPDFRAPQIEAMLAALTRRTAEPPADAMAAKPPEPVLRRLPRPPIGEPATGPSALPWARISKAPRYPTQHARAGP